MATPITWRNVGEPSFSGVQTGLASGGKAISSGLDRLTNLAKEQRTLNDENFDTVRDQNTNALLNQLRGIQSQQQLDQAIASGAFAVNPQDATVDGQKILAALQARPQELVDKQVTDDANALKLRQVAERPALETLAATKAKRDFTGARKLLESSNLSDATLAQEREKLIAEEKAWTSATNLERTEQIASSLMGTDMSYADMRNAMRQDENFLRLSPEEQTKVLKDTETRYTATRGFTTDQQKELEKVTAAAEADYQSEIERAEVAHKARIADIPRPQIYQRLGESELEMTMGKAVQDLISQTDDNSWLEFNFGMNNVGKEDLMEKVDTQLEMFANRNGLSMQQVRALPGTILAAAFAESTTRRGEKGDAATQDISDLSYAMERVYKQYNKEKESMKAFDDAKMGFITDKDNLRRKRDWEINEVEGRLHNENRIKQNFR